YGIYEPRGRHGVVLVHGITGAPVEMRYLARSLGRRGFTVACPQLAGHCESLRALKATRWRDWYASVEQAFEFVAERCDRVFISGLSMGALLALRLAAEKKAQVAGVATLSATFFYDGWNVPQLKQRLLLPIVLHSPLKYLLSYREPPPYGIKDERMRSLIEAMYSGREALRVEQAGYAEFPGVTVAETFRLIRAVKSSLGAVVSPTLVVHAVEDDMASVKNARFLAARLGTQWVETYLVDDCYHVLTLDKCKDDIATRVGRFFSECLQWNAAMENRGGND
ncbi:MAG TPA: alpha/beta fold hydrolase, partial [Nitrococcus sp.]|nr:alpha/beta fold hydrolase [Nitrococcus sp.]